MREEKKKKLKMLGLQGRITDKIKKMKFNTFMPLLEIWKCARKVNFSTVFSIFDSPQTIQK